MISEVQQKSKFSSHVYRKIHCCCCLIERPLGNPFCESLHFTFVFLIVLFVHLLPNQVQILVKFGHLVSEIEEPSPATYTYT